MLGHWYTLLLVPAAPAVGAAAVWAYVLPNGMTARAAMVQLVAQLNELHQIHGLQVAHPLTVSPTLRTAALIEQVMAEAGSTVTVTRQ